MIPRIITISILCIALITIGYHYQIGFDGNTSKLLRKCDEDFVESDVNSFEKETGLTEYKWYLYAKEWSGTDQYIGDCSKNNHLSSANDWNQHGIWPSMHDFTKVFKCTNEKFDINKFSSSQKEQVLSFWSGMFEKDVDF